MVSTVHLIPEKGKNVLISASCSVDEIREPTYHSSEVCTYFFEWRDRMAYRELYDTTYVYVSPHVRTLELLSIYNIFN